LETGPGQKVRDPKNKLKQKKKKKAEGMAQEVEHLSSKHKALNSNPSTATNTHKKMLIFKSLLSHTPQPICQQIVLFPHSGHMQNSISSHDLHKNLPVQVTIIFPPGFLQNFHIDLLPHHPFPHSLFSAE
jgi:hypothetical protein